MARRRDAVLFIRAVALLSYLIEHYVDLTAAGEGAESLLARWLELAKAEYDDPAAWQTLADVASHLHDNLHALGHPSAGLVDEIALDCAAQRTVWASRDRKGE